MTEIIHSCNFDSKECEAIVKDLILLQLAEADRSELKHSVNDLEKIINTAKGKFKVSEKPI